MNYNEFTSYLADRIVAIRTRESVPGTQRRRERYYDAVYASVLECRAFFDRLSLDEGPHNDYNPTSKASVEAYRVAMYAELAEELGNRVADACVRGDVSFLDSVLRYPVPYGQEVSDRRFAQVAAEHFSNFVFERTCAGCRAKYKVAVKAQTYRMVSNHPTTCNAVKVSPVQAAKPEVEVKPEVKVKAEGGEVEPMMVRLLRWEARQKNIKGPVIPQEMLDPAQKPAYNSPAYRANAKAALRLYADFLKFYEEDPSPKSKPEDNQRQVERMYNVVIRTVFNFDPNANKKQ